MALNVGVGDPFPAFSLPDQRGQPVSSQSFAGKPAVLYFYPQDATPGCTTEALEFTEQLSEFLSRGALVYGVSTDSVRAHERFCEKHRLGVTLLSDADGALSQKLGLRAILTGRAQRTTFLLDAKGMIVNIWEQVTPAGHARDVLTTLDRLRQEQKV